MLARGVLKTRVSSGPSARCRWLAKRCISRRRSTGTRLKSRQSWVRFFFFEGVALDDPQQRLEGSGNVMRSIRVDERVAVLDDPYVRKLMTQALKVAAVDLKKGSGQIVLGSTVAKPRSASTAPRRRRIGS